MVKVGLIGYGETGSAAFKSLFKKFDIEWVITPAKTDNSTSREVEKLARHHKVEIIRTNDEKILTRIIAKTKPRAVVISSYNRILPINVLRLSRFINVHHGDLPRWRGRANINWAIIKGRKKIGLTIHDASKDLDSGNIYAQYSITIRAEDTIRTVYDKFNDKIENELATVVHKVIAGFKGEKQTGRSTYCCTRLPEDGYIDWTQKSKDILNLIRAITKPYPGAFTYLNGRRLIVWDAEIPKNKRIYEGRIPGRVALIHKNLGVEILTGDSSIIIKNINLGGKDLNSADVIKSVKKTLGINLVEFYDNFQKMLESKVL